MRGGGGNAPAYSAPRALAASALEKTGDAGAVALHGAGEVLAEKALDALRVADRAIEERDLSRVGPRPHRAVANSFRRIRIEHRDARRIGAKKPRTARLLLEESSDGSEQIDSRRHTSS